MKTITLETLANVYKSPVISLETAKLNDYELIEELFVDSSGFGSENELALTQSQLLAKLNELVEKQGARFTCITRQGQFQVYIGVFKKGEKLSKKIAGNTLEAFNSKGEKIIRLYDTNIVTLSSGKIVLDNGGYATKTTHKRMNDFLSQYAPNYSVGTALGVSELRHNGTCTPFIGGMATITL